MNTGEELHELWTDEKTSVVTCIQNMTNPFLKMIYLIFWYILVQVFSIHTLQTRVLWKPFLFTIIRELVQCYFVLLHFLFKSLWKLTFWFSSPFNYIAVHKNEVNMVFKGCWKLIWNYIYLSCFGSVIYLSSSALSDGSLLCKPVK